MIFKKFVRKFLSKKRPRPLNIKDRGLWKKLETAFTATPLALGRLGVVPPLLKLDQKALFLTGLLKNTHGFFKTIFVVNLDFNHGVLLTRLPAPVGNLRADGIQS